MSNQRRIAQILGLHQSTVSLALRGSPSIPQATRERVEKTARKLGYTPHPYVSTLMEQIRRGKALKERGCLAIIVDAKDESDWLKHPAYRQQYEAICHRASLRGYRTECFFLQEHGMSFRKLDRILYSRGIVGLIFAAPQARENLAVEMQWNRYAMVSSGYTWACPAVDRISTHHRHHLETAFAELQQRGYRRIGFCVSETVKVRADSNWLAGWLLCQYRLAAKYRVPAFDIPRNTPLAKFRHWYDRWKPDALISLNGDELPWLKKLGLEPGKNLGMVCLFHPPGSDFTAIDENNTVIGEMLCDLLSSHLIHNERGIPAHPRLILVEGTWVEGKTVRLP